MRSNVAPEMEVGASKNPSRSRTRITRTCPHVSRDSRSNTRGADTCPLLRKRSGALAVGWSGSLLGGLGGAMIKGRLLHGFSRGPGVGDKKGSR
jgi:hypothetical protein